MRDRVILVIDDDDMNLQIAKMILEKKVKCRVICANGGHEGIEILRREHVSLVLLDIMMPDFDGIETLQEIRDDEDLKDTEIMMLTAAGGIDNLKKVYHLGVKDYIKKPFLPADLISRVNKKLDEINPVQSVLLFGTSKDELSAIQKIIEQEFDNETLIATSRTEAQKILRKEEITLVIIESQSKFIDGYKVLKFLSEDEKFSKIPVAITNSEKLKELVEKLNAPKIEKIAEKIESEGLITKIKHNPANVVTNLIGYELDVHV